ncbi:MAG: hypothetical protein AB7G23_18640 [Vicinamibacterales bacterium]
MLAGAALLLALAGGCGKKGPPLAPFVRIPAGVETITARRLGSDVFVTLTVPSDNIDESTPAAVARIDVYAYTGTTPPPRARWVELGTRVASIPGAADMRSPEQSSEDRSAQEAEAPPAGGDTGDQRSPAAEPEGVVPGAVVTLRDTLTAAALTPPVAPAAVSPAGRGTVPPLVPPTVPPVSPPVGPGEAGRGGGTREGATLRRYYTAIPFAPDGRPGPPGAVAVLALATVPPPPVAVSASFTETDIVVQWRMAPSAVPPPTVPPADGAAPSRLRFNLYRLPGPTETAPQPSWPAAVPTAVTAQPIDATEFREPVAFGEQRCYVVRTVAPAPDAAESEAAAPACVTPQDTFAPDPPRGLSALAVEGAINLLWEPGTEADLAGYLVLRGSPGDATLQRLTPLPIAEARFRDQAVVSGVAYEYAVVAVDRRQPSGNVSDESNRVTETAR